VARLIKGTDIIGAGAYVMLRDDADELMRRVGNNYLSLIRENFLEDGKARPFFESIAANASRRCLEALLDLPDWRPRLVGAFFVMINRDHSFEAELGSLPRAHPILQRPITVALVVLKTPSAAHMIRDLAQLPYNKDGFDDYAAAIEALAILGDPLAERWFSSMTNQLSQETFYDPDGFASSRKRFRDGVQYWI
jgi:hypothetical protein